jgi:hypothetical protein
MAVRGNMVPWWTQNATLGGARSDVASATGRTDYANSGWSASGYAVPLTPGTYNVRAFAYDTSNARTRLASDKTITVTAQSGSFASLSLSSLDFGNVNPKSATVVKTAQLSNLGTAALTISSISAPSGWSQANTCGSNLAVGAICTITISFVPAKFGPNAGSLQVTSNSINGQVSVSLTGFLDLAVTVTRPIRTKRTETVPAPVSAGANPAAGAATKSAAPVLIIAIPQPSIDESAGASKEKDPEHKKKKGRKSVEDVPEKPE